MHFRRDSPLRSDRVSWIGSLSVLPYENGKDNSQAKCQNKGQSAYYFIYRAL